MGSSVVLLEGLKTQDPRSSVPLVLAHLHRLHLYPHVHFGQCANPLNSPRAMDAAQRQGQQHFCQSGPLWATPPIPFPGLPFGISDVEETAQPCGRSNDSLDSDDNASDGPFREG